MLCEAVRSDLIIIDDSCALCDPLRCATVSADCAKMTELAVVITSCQMPKRSAEKLIEELAISIGHGFAEQQERFNELRHEVRDGLAAIHTRLDRIEFLASGQEHRISVLEDRVRQLGTKLGYQFN